MATGSVQNLWFRILRKDNRVEAVAKLTAHPTVEAEAQLVPPAIDHTTTNWEHLCLFSLEAFDAKDRTFCALGVVCGGMQVGCPIRVEKCQIQYVVRF